MLHPIITFASLKYKVRRSKIVYLGDIYVMKINKMQTELVGKNEDLVEICKQSIVQLSSSFIGVNNKTCLLSTKIKMPFFLQNNIGEIMM